MTRPKKSLGQHFLVNPRVAKRIVEACAITSEDYVLEVGPGKGALTEHLVRQTSNLFAVEKDEEAAAKLSERFFFKKEMTVGDALAYILNPRYRWIVVGNLPYNVGLPILFHFLDQARHVKRMIFMLQKEVAERLAAKPGGKNYGIPSVLLQAEAEVRLLFHVGPGNFAPPPKVDSSVIEIIPTPSPFVDAAERTRFAALVKRAFATRRKMIGNTLAGYRDRFAACGLSGKERAEDLAIRDFLTLMRTDEKL